MNIKPEKWVFISSPSDVAAERVIADRVFRRLAKEFVDDLTVRLVLWEMEPLAAHGDFQRQLRAPSACDLVISILWTRLGTPLPQEYAAAPGLPPPTGTEFEIMDALAGHERTGRPELLIYVKKEDAIGAFNRKEFDSRWEQFKKLDDFLGRLLHDEAGASVVAHHSFRDAAEFERKLLEHIRKWLEDQIAGTSARPRWTRGSPFCGLRPFDSDHREVFFGRSQALAELVGRLNATESRRDSVATPKAEEVESRLLLIVGMSGNGKTSLVRAGLVPQLDDLPVDGISAWDAVELRPSDVATLASDAGPFGALSAALLSALGQAAMLDATLDSLAQELEFQPELAARQIKNSVLVSNANRRGLPAQAEVRLLVYVDQLEELFTLAELASRADRFLTSLAALASVRHVWVVATLRSDFTHRLETNPAVMKLLHGSAPYTLLPPRGAELADMIREPALAAGLKFEQRAGLSLDTAMLHEATQSPEVLPLLQYALQQLYEQQQDRLLLWSAYDEMGGLRGALVKVADGLLPADGDDLAFRRVMRELATVSDDGSATRRYASLNVFGEGTAERELIGRFVTARLCVTDDRAGEPVVFLAHEAMLQSWPRVQRWLLQESALLRLRDEIQRDAKAWISHGRKDDWLGTAADKLAGIAQLERESVVLTGSEAEYVGRSRQRARRDQQFRTAVVAVICGLGLVSAGAAWMAFQQRNHAQQQALIADRTSRFMVSLFELADPEESRGNSITVREVLDRGAAEIGENMVGDAQVRADLMTAMGSAYRGLGLYPAAIRLLEKARSDTARARVSDDSVVRTLVAYGTTVALASDKQDEEAERVLRDALATATARLPAQSVLISDARNGLADVLVKQKKFAEAERLCRESLAVDRARVPSDIAVLSRTLNTLGFALFYDRQLAEVEAPWTEALKLREQYLGKQHAATAESMGNLGAWYYETGKYAQARDLWNKALPVYRTVFGAEHPELASMLVNVGRATLMEGNVLDSIPLFEQALAMDEKFKDATDRDLVTPLNSLTMAHLYLGDVQQARKESTRALGIARSEDNELLDQVLLNAADVAIASHDLPTARSLLEESRKSLEARHPLATQPESVWRYAVWDTVNAELIGASGNRERARGLLEKARTVLVARFGASGYYVKRVESLLRPLGA